MRPKLLRNSSLRNPLWKTSLFLLLTFSLAACVREIRPLPSDDDTRIFQIKTVYGLVVDGTRESAQKVLTEEATHACQGDFEVIGSEEIPAGKSEWAAKHGHIEYFWNVRCLN